MTDLQPQTEPSPQVPARPFPGFAHALLVLLLFIVFTGIASAPAGALKFLGFTRVLPWANLAAQLGGLALTLWICTLLGHQDWRQYFPHRPVRPAVWPWVVLATIGLILLSNGMDGLLQRVLPMPGWLSQAFENMGWPMIVIGAPLTEEPLMRGVVLGGFLLRYGPRKAIGYSALLFALLHMNPWQLPTALAAGIFLGWLVLRTGSIWPCIFAHFINNFAAVLSEKYHLPYLHGAALQPLWMWALGVVAAVLAIGALHRLPATKEEDSLLVEGLA